MKKSGIRNKVEGNELDLSLNNLTEVPVQELADLPRATHLDLSCNKISSLPVSFAALTHLVKIDLSKNFLKELPHNFGNLHNLQSLDLYENQIEILPISFCRLKQLKWLDLKNNPLDPKLKQVTGDCLSPKQCQECAKNVVAFMQTVESEMERRKQKRLKEERELEAIQKAKMQQELEEQRKLKKAERERRKAEAKLQKNKSQVVKEPNSDSTELINNDSYYTNYTVSEKAPKSGSWLKTCLIFPLLLMVLLCISLVSFHLFTKYEEPVSVNSLINSLNVATHELSDIILIWWNALAYPYICSLAASFNDFVTSYI